MLEAARNNVEILPFLFGTPSWAAQDLDNRSCSPPSACSTRRSRSAALQRLVDLRRRGGRSLRPGGEFWAQHPQVARIRSTRGRSGTSRTRRASTRRSRSRRSYAKLLKASAEGDSRPRRLGRRDPRRHGRAGRLEEGDRRLRVSGEALRRQGRSKSFDGVAPHPYGKSINKVSEPDRSLQRRDQGGPRQEAWACGSPRSAPARRSGGNPLNVGDKGQAKLLKKIYKYFLKQRNKLHVKQVDWYSWQDATPSICSWCGSSGLLESNGNPKPSFGAFTKFTGGKAG